MNCQYYFRILITLDRSDFQRILVLNLTGRKSALERHPLLISGIKNFKFSKMEAL